MNIGVGAFVLAMIFVVETVVTTQDRVPREPQRYCGGKLADTMQLLCRGKYHFTTTTPKLRKRSPTDAYTWDYEDSAEDLYETKSKSEAMQYYIMPSSSSMRVLSKKNRKNGIIEECCRRACDVSELLGYCAQ